ncbi:hypothetical protein O181_025825 [Austropuccinia psidii MF-1]|uniref:Reverse transcriptase domain-containing protein n=1 Tax=Austropuccinia psidii MF-1 TaxID=1389203 RepID=A0A9Q3CN93_9BASI|nr:hypothetical protein [Austropuccinia psidii MF-1]
MSRTTFRSPGEDGEEEDFDGTEAAPAPVGASEGTRGPILAQSDQPVSHQTEPSLLAIMQQMTQIMANLQAAASSKVSKPPAFKTPSIKALECFDGTQPFKVRSFIQSCQLIFNNYPANFSQDRKKVLYATSFLVGRAAKWIEPYLSNLTNQDSRYLLNSWPLFESQLFTLFGDPNEVRKAEAELDGLRMKEGWHVSLYITGFRSLVSTIGDWGERALIHHFRKGLASSILDQLASHPSNIDSLQDLMDVSLEFDTRYHERQKEKNYHQEKKPEASKSNSSHHQNSSSSSHKKKNFHSQKLYKPHSSLLNKVFKLKCSEKERRIKEGLCTYCGGKNSLESCVKRPQNKLTQLQGLITFNADQKYYSDPSNSFCNDFSSAKSCAALVGDSRTPSFPYSVHIPSIYSPQSLPLSGDEVFKEIQDVGEDNSVSSLHLCFGNMDLPPSSYHDSLEELWDEEEEPEEVETVMKVVPSTYHQYLDVFSKVKAEKLPPHHACYHHIKHKGALPPVWVIYSLSKQQSDKLRAYISENVEKGFIRPSSSSTGAPVLFVKKKDYGLRLCVDYHKLNAVTRKNKYPVPPTNPLLNFFNGSSIFSKIDLCGAYNLLRIKEGDEHLTCFRTKYGSFEYLVMPFGLTNAPASFQNLVNDIFQDLIDVHVVVYLDDIMVLSQYEEEHVTHVSTVHSRLRANNLFAKASKCQFHVSSVE